MDYGYTNTIRKRIDHAPSGTIFTCRDFRDVADPNTVKQTISRLAQSGSLRRLFRGFYDKPRYNSFLGEYVAPDTSEVAKAIARSNGWTIGPSGDHALNELGLDTQVPMKAVYVSDGPNRTYRMGKRTIEFRHRTEREITGLSPITIAVIQALKALGREGTDERVLSSLRRRLSEEQRQTLLSESTRATDWVRSSILMICLKGGMND